MSRPRPARSMSSLGRRRVPACPRAVGQFESMRPGGWGERGGLGQWGQLDRQRARARRRAPRDVAAAGSIIVFIVLRLLQCRCEQRRFQKCPGARREILRLLLRKDFAETVDTDKIASPEKRSANSEEHGIFSCAGVSARARGVCETEGTSQPLQRKRGRTSENKFRERPNLLGGFYKRRFSHEDSGSRGGEADLLAGTRR